MIISKNCTRIPLVRKTDGTPFVWHDITKSRIEFRHGQKTTFLQLERDTPVFFSHNPNHFRKIRGEPIKDLDRNIIASWVGGADQEEWDTIVIRHSKKITCLSIPKGTQFQVQYYMTNAV